MTVTPIPVIDVDTWAIFMQGHIHLTVFGYFFPHTVEFIAYKSKNNTQWFFYPRFYDNCISRCVFVDLVDFNVVSHHVYTYSEYVIFYLNIQQGYWAVLCS